MPVILEEQDWPMWLGEVEDDHVALLRPAPDGLLRVWPVDRRRLATEQRAGVAGEHRRVGASSTRVQVCGIAISHTGPTGIPCAKAETERRKVVMPNEGRELYRSPNGDRWLLIREALSDRVLVRHEPNRPSGGKASVVEVGDFLSRGHGPEQQALLRLIGSLVEAR
jgi:hypothetical protein